MSTVLVIDGENFLHKVKEVLVKAGAEKKKLNISHLDFTRLLHDPLKGLNVTRRVFYVAKIHVYPETIRKSEELIRFQRKLRNNLVKHRFEFVVAGNVRAQKVGNKIVFREKGVDVKIAVDMVSLACDKKLTTAILCSSDSDLQPLVAELQKRKVEVIYLGFEINPNRGLTYTTDRTILFRNSEVLEACLLQAIVSEKKKR